MRIAVLKAERASRATQARRGDFDVLFQRLLQAPNQQWETFAINEGMFPQSAQAFDAYIISGSPAAIYDDTPWVRQLEGFVHDIHQQRSILLGVCFGAQMVAQALGGKVGVNAKGWELGVKQLQLTPAAHAYPALQQAPQPLLLLQTHRDIITQLPPKAQLLGNSTNTPCEMFCLGENILCLQGHPEMDNEQVSELVEKRWQRGFFEEADAKPALKSMTTLTPSRSFWSVLLTQFMQQGCLSSAQALAGTG